MSLSRIVRSCSLKLRTVVSVSSSCRTFTTSSSLEAKPAGGVAKAGAKGGKGIVKAPLLDAETDAYKVRQGGSTHLAPCYTDRTKAPFYAHCMKAPCYAQRTKVPF